MSPEQEIIFLKTHISMLQETANSAQTALEACEAQLQRMTKQLDELKPVRIGRCDMCGAAGRVLVPTNSRYDNGEMCCADGCPF